MRFGNNVELDLGSAAGDGVVFAIHFQRGVQFFFAEMRCVAPASAARP